MSGRECALKDINVNTTTVAQITLTMSTNIFAYGHATKTVVWGYTNVHVYK